MFPHTLCRARRQDSHARKKGSNTFPERQSQSLRLGSRPFKIPYRPPRGGAIIKVRKKPPLRFWLILAFFAAAALISCDTPFRWNADIRTFVQDGTTVLRLGGFSAAIGGSRTTVIKSGKETILALGIVNTRGVDLSCSVGWNDSSLFDSLPVATIRNTEEIVLSFTPSLIAERRDLVLSVELSVPSYNRVFAPEVIVVHCNTPPGGVGASLDAAFDATGTAFAAFRLPSSPTDDDLTRVEISYAPDGAAGPEKTLTLAVDDASLLATRTTFDGRNLLGDSQALNRYFRPTDIGSGDNYLFKVRIIDVEGLGSELALTTSDATAYTVTFDGNGSTSGSAPVDPATYRHTKPVILPGPGTLERVGYSFAGWNTEADGSGSAFAAGDNYSMGAANLLLFAQWNINTYAVVFDSRGGNAVPTQSLTFGALVALPSPDPSRSGYTFAGWYREPACVTAWSFAADSLPASNLILYAEWIPLHSVTVTFGITNPSYGTIDFSAAAPTVALGQQLSITGTIAGASAWSWYMDNTLQPAQTTSSFSWTAAGTPGQHIINVDAMYQGYPCTGSILVTVVAP
jgi:uncharacterized repeat protein (TIGR02543 family)